MPTLSAAGRHDLADDQWIVLGPLLPRGKKPGRPPRWSRRQLTDGIRWRTRTGSPWRDIPSCYGPWQSVYGLFRRWQRDGTWRLPGPELPQPLQRLVPRDRSREHRRIRRARARCQQGMPGPWQGLQPRTRPWQGMKHGRFLS